MNIDERASYATYILMTINSVSLFMRFMDGSKQEEKVQSIKFDRWAAEPVDLVESGFELSLMLFDEEIQGIPPDVGRIVAYQ